MVTTVPAGPDVGLTPDTAGAGGGYVKLSAANVALVPPGPVTITSTVPDPAGAVTVIWVSDTTVKLDAAVAPNDTPVAPVNPLPVIVTTVPAAPEVGLKPVMVGAAGV